MGAIAALIMYAIEIGVILFALYWVIRKAVKDALKDYNKENKQ